MLFVETTIKCNGSICVRKLSKLLTPYFNKQKLRPFLLKTLKILTEQ